MKLVTQEDYHQKIMECIEADDLAAALDYIEAAEHLEYDMNEERIALETATDNMDADFKANEQYDRLLDERI